MTEETIRRLVPIVCDRIEKLIMDNIYNLRGIIACWADIVLRAEEISPGAMNLFLRSVGFGESINVVTPAGEGRVIGTFKYPSDYSVVSQIAHILNKDRILRQITREWELHADKIGTVASDEIAALRTLIPEKEVAPALPDIPGLLAVIELPESFKSEMITIARLYFGIEFGHDEVACTWSIGVLGSPATLPGSKPESELAVNDPAVENPLHMHKQRKEFIDRLRGVVSEIGTTTEAK